MPPPPAALREHNKRPQAAARRAAKTEAQKRWRAHQKAGEAIYPAPGNGRILNMLLTCRWLSEADIGDKQKVGLAMFACLDDSAKNFE